MTQTRKAAVVTGGGRGVGRSVARALAADGVRVVVNDSSDADAVVDEIERAGGVAVANHDSVATFAGCKTAIDTAVSSFGRIDIVANCAGTFVSTELPELTEEDFQTALTDLKSHVGTAKAAVPHMLEQGEGGRLIMFSSLAAFMSDEHTAHATVKAGIMGLASELAMRLAGEKITVNCVFPGAASEFFPSGEPEFNGAGGDAIGAVPVATSLDPDDVAPLVVFLASDQAAEVTNQYIYASGNDVCVYRHPFSTVDRNAMFRKPDRWTAGGLSEVVLPMLDIG